MLSVDRIKMWQSLNFHSGDLLYTCVLTWVLHRWFVSLDLSSVLDVAEKKAPPVAEQCAVVIIHPVSKLLHFCSHPA